jgi:hypothetical protein
MATLILPESTPQLAATPGVFFTLGEVLQGDDRQFVGNAYWAMFGRAVDDTGLKIYTAMLAGGNSRIEVLIELRNSAEGQVHRANLDGLDGAKTLAELLSHQDHAFVSCAYQTLLSRPIDAGALARYATELSNGMDRLQVLNEIVGSNEFKSRNAIALEIERIGVAGKPPALVASYADVTSNGGEGERMAGLPDSAAELLARGNRDFIRGLNQILLAREPDAEGLENYLTCLESGLPRHDVIYGISHSVEREARRSMLRQIESAINDVELQKSPLLGIGARMRRQALEQSVAVQKFRILENQLFSMSQSQKAQLARVESLLGRQVETSRAIQMKNVSPLKLNQLSPLAQDIYFQLKNGLDQRKERGA